MKREAGELFWMFMATMEGIALVLLALNAFAEQIGWWVYSVWRLVR